LHGRRRRVLPDRQRARPGGLARNTLRDWPDLPQRSAPALQDLGGHRRLPLALAIGNTTRVLMGSIGFQDIGARLSAMGDWQEALNRTPVLVSTFHRLFFVGGHSIIAYTPEYYHYLDFSWTDYGWEFLTRLLPGKLFYAPFYSDNERLRDYGFLITDESSFPMSLLGSLYMLGGLIPVAAGATAFGVFHS